MMSSQSVESCTEEVKKLTRSVLLSKIGGVPLGQFDKDYRELMGRRFPYRELGFSDVRSCLESMSDAVRMEFSNDLQKWMLFGIADDHSFMSSPAIKAQFTPDKPIVKRKRTRNKKFSSKKSSDSDESTGRHAAQKAKRHPAGDSLRPVDNSANDFLKLKPNMNGLYGICVQQLPPEYEMEVQQLFSEVASSEETSRGGVHFFLRYSNIKEAQEIISRFHNYQLNDLTLKVYPAKEKISGRAAKQTNSPRSKTTTKEDVESRESMAHQPNEGALCLPNGMNTEGHRSRTSNGKQTSTGKYKGSRERGSQNKSKNYQQSSHRKNGENKDEDETWGDEEIPVLPWKQTPQPNGHVLDSDNDGISASLQLPKPDKFAASRPTEPVSSCMSSESVCHRTIPKPRLPSILDLADRFKESKM